MSKVELLSPAGNYNKAIAAINSGADALYLGYNEFSARAFSDNFNEEELIKIVDLAHIYGVKIHVTFNTLIDETELKKALQVIDLLYRIKVDCLIIQDLGMVDYVRSNYPDFEIHASTQMNIYNQNALTFLKALGIKRAVLARECTIEKIKSFKDIKIEKEVFVHGALCVSFSGQCLFSSLNSGRSGNKGNCAQNCRMYYYLNRGETQIAKGYLLSTKDLMNFDNVSELIEAGVDSLKIEGRMKSAAYVGFVTKMYRKKLDDLSYKLSAKEKEQLKIIFNRDYTYGLLKHEYGDMFINTYRPNHIGIQIGKVVRVDNAKYQIKLTHDLSQHDGIRIIQDQNDVGFTVNKMYQNGLLVNSAKANDLVEFDLVEKVKVNSPVLLTSSNSLNKQLSKLNDEKRVIEVNCEISVKNGQPLIIKISNELTSITYKSDFIIETAINQAISNERLIEQIKKSGDSLLKIKEVTCFNDYESFISIKELNECRRQAINDFENTLKTVNFKRVAIPYHLVSKPCHFGFHKFKVSVLNEEQFLTCQKYQIEDIYSDNLDLYHKYPQMIKLISNNVYNQNYQDVTMVGEIGGIGYGKELDYSLNVTNTKTITFLNKFAVKSITLSCELKDSNLEAMNLKAIDSCPLEMIAYGKIKLMSNAYCMVNHHELNNDKQNCSLCKKNQYYLKDIHGKSYYLRGDCDCIMHVYHHEVRDYSNRIDYYQNLGIKIFRIAFTDENSEEIKKVFKKFQILNK